VGQTQVLPILSVFAVETKKEEQRQNSFSKRISVGNRCIMRLNIMLPRRQLFCLNGKLAASKFFVAALQSSSLPLSNFFFFFFKGIYLQVCSKVAYTIN
jgi:hypothetical protein